jgi:hypothetical protein
MVEREIVVHQLQATVRSRGVRRQLAKTLIAAEVGELTD